MKAPFQILSIPYRIKDGIPYCCVLHRPIMIIGRLLPEAGEDDKTPLQAAMRETRKESSIQAENISDLMTLSCLPVTIAEESCRQHWDKSIYVIPEYTFGSECTDEIRLSDEYLECEWLTCEEASGRLTWDSNRAALSEHNCRLKGKQNEHKLCMVT